MHEEVVDAPCARAFEAVRGRLDAERALKAVQVSRQRIDVFRVDGVVHDRVALFRHLLYMRRHVDPHGWGA